MSESTTTLRAALSRRVSRRELAVNRTVWLATGGMFRVLRPFSPSPRS